MMLRKRKNKVLFIMKRYLRFKNAVPFGLAFLSVIPLLCAALQNGTVSELFSPSLQVLEQPHGSYQSHDIIEYRVHVSWPKMEGDIRLEPPRMKLTNLHFLGMSQETTTELHKVIQQDQASRVLNFKFQALAPGKASIEKLSLTWLYDDGPVSSSLALPNIDLTIKKPFPVFWLSGALLITVFISLGSFLLIAQKKAQTALAPEPKSVIDFSTQRLTELAREYENWKANGNSNSFLNYMSHVMDRYFKDRLNWTITHNAPSDLSSRIEMMWNKSDATQMAEHLKQLEISRFAGAPPDTHKIEALYRYFHKFIYQKRIL
jgi:hypothetical protein